MSRTSGVPSYRRRIVRSRPVAVVTIHDSTTGRRRDVWLGEYGSPESRAKYARVLARWEEAGRRLPEVVRPLQPAGGPTVTQVMAAYWPTVTSRFSAKHVATLGPMLRRWREHFGRYPAAEITPAMLREWRTTVVREVSVDNAKRATTAVLAMFRWAVSYDLLPVQVYQRLRTLEPLPRGPRKRIGPAPESGIDTVRDLVSDQVKAMIDLQLATGMRPGEVCALRPCDIAMGDSVWHYRPADHKTAHHGHERIIYLGPKAQAILRPFMMGRAINAHLFSPIESAASRRAARTAARKTPLSCGNRPGSRRTPNPRRKPGERFTSAAYGRAIRRACDLAGIPRWHPHQLRHNYATEIRKRYGLEAARVLLGHCSALVTEAVYAERDHQAAMRIAAEVG